MTKAWEDKRIPDDWNEVITIRIPEKGASNDCSNWRGITLLSISSKILAKIFINRLSRCVIDSRLREDQAGFRKGKGCIHQIFTLVYETSSSSVQNGRKNFISTLWILKRRLIASIEAVFGRSWGITGFHKKLSLSYRVFTTTAESVTTNTAFLCCLE